VLIIWPRTDADETASTGSDAKKPKAATRNVRAMINRSHMQRNAT
jgi:hypothetical protein